MFSRMAFAGLLAGIITVCVADTKWLFCKNLGNDNTLPTRKPTATPQNSTSKPPRGSRPGHDFCCGKTSISTEKDDCCMGQKINKRIYRCCPPHGRWNKAEDCPCKSEAWFTSEIERTKIRHSEIVNLNATLNKEKTDVQELKDSYDHLKEILKSLRNIEERDGEEREKMLMMALCAHNRSNIEELVDLSGRLSDAKDTDDYHEHFEAVRSDCVLERKDVESNGFFGFTADINVTRYNIARKNELSNIEDVVKSIEAKNRKICQITCMMVPLSNEIISIDFHVNVMSEEIKKISTFEEETLSDTADGSFGSDRPTTKPSEGSCNETNWIEHVEGTEMIQKNYTELATILTDDLRRDDGLYTNDICAMLWNKPPKDAACKLQKEHMRN